MLMTEMAVADRAVERSVETQPKSILIAAHTPLGAPFVVGSHHLLRELGAAGIHTAHMAFPCNPLNLALRSKHGPVRFRLWLRTTFLGAPDGGEVPLFSLLPWGSRKLSPRPGYNPLLTTLPSMTSALGRRGLLRPDLLIVDHPRWDGLEDIVKPRRMIYRPTDLYTAKEGNLAIHEANLAARSDGWVVTSRLLADHLRALVSDMRDKPVAVMENGVLASHFCLPTDRAPELEQIPGPRAVYVGAFDDRFDFAAVRLLAEQRPDWSVVLIGPKPNGKAEKKPPNVHYLGAVPHKRLPAFLQHCDVGLLPTNDHPLNAARSPMKLYEYAAAGLPVVARETQELLSRGEPFVFGYGQPGEIVTCLAKATAWAADNQGVAQRCAEKRDWPSLTQELLAFVKTLPSNERRDDHVH